jgi:hypothetical protein
VDYKVKLFLRLERRLQKAAKSCNVIETNPFKENQKLKSFYHSEIHLKNINRSNLRRVKSWPSSNNPSHLVIKNTKIRPNKSKSQEKDIGNVERHFSIKQSSLIDFRQHFRTFRTISFENQFVCRNRENNDKRINLSLTVIKKQNKDFSEENRIRLYLSDNEIIDDKSRCLEFGNLKLSRDLKSCPGVHFTNIS